MSIGNGGYTIVSNSTIVGNRASQFGGGALFGTISPATCAFSLTNQSRIEDNVALGAAQIYSVCSADVLFDSTTVVMSAATSQVCGTTCGR